MKGNVDLRGLLVALVVLAGGCDTQASLGGGPQPSADASASHIVDDIGGSRVDARGPMDEPTDASAEAGADAGANACVFSASSYDQSCATDSDCTLEISTDYCRNDVCRCPTSPISVAGRAQFQADIANTPLGSGALQWPLCSCQLAPPICCRAGTCTKDCASLPACTAAGGACKGVTSCPRGVGPAGSCLYADDLCCLD